MFRIEKKDTAFPRSVASKIWVVMGIIIIAMRVTMMLATVFTRAAFTVAVLSDEIFDDCKIKPPKCINKWLNENIYLS